MNLVILLGRVGKKPDDLRYTPDGKPVLKFSLVTDDGYGDNKKATWHDIVAFQKTAELVAEHVVQGQQVLIEGTIRKRSWEGQDGQKRYSTEVIANRVQFLAKPKPKGQEQAQEQGADDVDPEDIPF